MKRCSSCGASNPETQMICEQCGAPLDPSPEIEGGALCVVCGYRNPAEAVFCEQCGARLEPLEPEGTEEVQAVAPEEASQPGEADWLSALEELLPETPPVPPAPEAGEEEPPSLQIGEQAPAAAESPAPHEWTEGPILLEQPIEIEGAPFSSELTFPEETPSTLASLLELPGETSEVAPEEFLRLESSEEILQPPSETPPWGTEPFVGWPSEWEQEKSSTAGFASFSESGPEVEEQAEALPSPGWEGEQLPEWLRAIPETAEPPVPSSEAVISSTPGVDLEAWPLEEAPQPMEGTSGESEVEEPAPRTSPFWIEEMPAGAPPEEVPPFTDLEAALAEMPEWLRTFQPVSEEGGEAPAEAILAAEPAVVETRGPLAGLVDVLPLNPRVLEVPGPAARLTAEPPSDLLTRAQAWRSLLDHGLEFLAGERAVERVAADLGVTLERTLLFAIILGVLIIGLYWPLPFFQAALLAPPQGFLAALDRVPSGGLALVAVDYGPDRAAELEPYLQRVLDRLTARGVRVLTVSLSPWGSAQAMQVVSGRPDYGERLAHLGYSPGQEVGVARLLTQPADQLGIDYRGQPLKSLPIAQDFDGEPLAIRLDLVVLITGSPDAMQGWIQQAYGLLRPETPIVAAVGMNLWPYAAPYQESGQIQAIAVGMRDALLFEGPPVEGSPAFFDLQAQTLLQVFLIVLIGIGLAIRLLPRRARARGRG